MSNRSQQEPVQGEGHLKADPSTVAGSAILQWATEHWQFFAFVFAALVALAFALLDEIPDHAWIIRVTAKVIAFLLLACLTLRNKWVKYRLVTVLGIIKEVQ